MAIDVAQGTVKSGATVANLTTDAITTAASGSCLVMALSINASRTYTPSDSKGNTWTQLEAQTLFNGALSAVRWWYCENATGGSSHTFTVTINSGGNSDIVIHVAEITGGLTSGILDATPSSNEDNTSPFTSPGHTTTNADDLLLSYLSGATGSNPATHTPGNSFTIVTQETNGASFYASCLMKRVVSATGTYNSTCTQTGATSTRVTIASFKAAAGAGTTRGTAFGHRGTAFGGGRIFNGILQREYSWRQRLNSLRSETTRIFENASVR
jgi:hypothetical protein